jgi:hypothetical protein
LELELGVLGIEVVVVVFGSGSGREHVRVERGKRYGEEDGNLNLRM